MILTPNLQMFIEIMEPKVEKKILNFRQNCLNILVSDSWKNNCKMAL